MPVLLIKRYIMWHLYLFHRRYTLDVPYYPTTFSQNDRRCLILSTDVDKVLGKDPTKLSFEGEPIGGSSLVSFLFESFSSLISDDGVLTSGFMLFKVLSLILPFLLSR